MKRLPYTRPLLQSGHCVFADYDVDWLCSLLQDAASRAGVSLPFTREIAGGIMSYLDQACPLRSLPLEYLVERVRETLIKLGLPLVAENLQRSTPPVDVCLCEIAEEESNLPLFFYTQLRQKLKQLHQLGVNNYRFRDMDECSRLLSARKRECPTSQRQRKEIESFLLQPNLC